jgi:hypothetical protein
VTSNGAEEERVAQVWIAGGDFSYERPDEAGSLPVEPLWNADIFLDGG